MRFFFFFVASSAVNAVNAVKNVLQIAEIVPNEADRRLFSRRLSIPPSDSASISSTDFSTTGVQDIRTSDINAIRTFMNGVHGFAKKQYGRRESEGELPLINVFSSSSAPPRGLLVNVIGGTDADRIAWLSLIPSALSSSVANNYALSSPVTTLDAPFETMEVDLSGEEVESSRSLLESIVSGEEHTIIYLQTTVPEQGNSLRFLKKKSDLREKLARRRAFLQKLEAEAERKLMKARRRLAGGDDYYADDGNADDGNADDGNAYNNYDGPDAFTISYMNIFLWSALVLSIVTYYCIYLLCYMHFEEDSLLFGDYGMLVSKEGRGKKKNN